MRYTFVQLLERQLFSRFIFLFFKSFSAIIAELAYVGLRRVSQCALIPIFAEWKTNVLTTCSAHFARMMSTNTMKIFHSNVRRCLVFCHIMLRPSIADSDFLREIWFRGNWWAVVYVGLRVCYDYDVHLTGNHVTVHCACHYVTNGMTNKWNRWDPKYEFNKRIRRQKNVEKSEHEGDFSI